MSEQERILIIGAGLVGCTLSVYLARRGHLVDIYEKHHDPRGVVVDGGRSINLTLCERGYKSLERIGALERVKKLVIPAYGRIMHELDGTTTYQRYGTRDESIDSVSRTKLNHCLLDVAEEEPGVTIHFGKKCSSVDPDGPSAIFEDTAGGQAEPVVADRLFGADGAYSDVRSRLPRQDRFNFKYSQYYVPQGYTELRLPAKADGSWAIEKNALHIWPRGERMLIGFANTDGSFTVALHLPFEGEDSLESIRDEASLLELFEKLFPDAVELLPRLTEEFFDHPQTSMVTVRCSPWTYRDKVALVGDAAHAIVPSYGQGANSGFQDCSVLADCFDAAEGDWGAAFAAYEARQKPNADAIAQLALDHFDELQVRVADPDFLLEKKIELRIETLFPDVYASLYSLVSFTDLPYVEAIRRAKGMEQVVEDLRRGGATGEELESGALDGRIRAAVEEAGLS